MRSRTTNQNQDHDLDQKVGAPAFLWWIVGVIALVEFTLSAADAGVIGTPEWRWIGFTYGAFWQPPLSNDVGSVFSGHFVTMFITYAFLHGGIAHLLLNSVVLLALGKMVAGSVGVTLPPPPNPV
jgi:membrane associated rhomboid family serine protease